MNRAIFPILWAPASVLLLHLVVYWSGLYERYPDVDILIHLLGGLALAHALAQALRRGCALELVRIRPPALAAGLLVAGTALGAVFWELGEFVLDNLIGSRLLGDLHDTLTDLLTGVVGAGVYAVFYFRRALGR